MVDQYFHPEAKGKTSVLDALRSYLSTATLQFLRHGGLNVDFYNTADVTLKTGAGAAAPVRARRHQSPVAT